MGLSPDPLRSVALPDTRARLSIRWAQCSDFAIQSGPTWKSFSRRWNLVGVLPVSDAAQHVRNLGSSVNSPTAAFARWRCLRWRFSRTSSYQPAFQKGFACERRSVVNATRSWGFLPRVSIYL